MAPAAGSTDPGAGAFFTGTRRDGDAAGDTERLEAALAAAAAARRDLESFSYVISHDLRAPLRAVDGYARILAEDYAGRLDDEATRCIDTICAQARHMGRLIDELLTFSRLGRVAMCVGAVNMVELAETVSAEIRQQDPGREVTLVLHALPPAHGDPRLLRQVFVHLLSNAWKFTRATTAPRIEIGARHADGVVTYWVRDNGAGFDMAYADKLFGVFQRLHGPEEFEGTGIGLALVQRIIQRHGGRVWAEAAVGAGATVRFTLPPAIGETTP